MNYTMVKRLMFKEWYFRRWMIAGYLITGIIALAIVAIGTNASFYAGTVLLLTALIAVGAQLAILAGTQERQEQTLAFVMTLPVSPKEYSLAKIAANLGMYVIPWGILLIGTIALFGIGAKGMIPFATLVFVEVLAAFCLLFCVSLVTESQEWAVALILVTNVFFQGFLYFVSHLPSIGPSMRAPTANWNATAVGLLLGELATIAFLVALTFFLQSRKRDFI